MKKIFNSFLVLLVCIVIVSCNTSQHKEVTINNKFRIEVPGYMQPTRSLNNEASMQYQSTIRELYLIVIEDNPEEIHEAINEINKELVEEGEEADFPYGFEGFCLMVASDDFDSFITYDDWYYLQEDKINSMNAYTFENSRKINGVEVYYKFAMVEGKNTFYQVIIWTLAEREKRYKNIIDRMIASFSEI